MTIRTTPRCSAAVFALLIAACSGDITAPPAPVETARVAASGAFTPADARGSVAPDTNAYVFISPLPLEEMHFAPLALEPGAVVSALRIRGQMPRLGAGLPSFVPVDTLASPHGFTLALYRRTPAGAFERVSDEVSSSGPADQVLVLERLSARVDASYFVGVKTRFAFLDLAVLFWYEVDYRSR